MFAADDAFAEDDNKDTEKDGDHEDEDGGVWIKKLTAADTILVNDDLTGSQLAELDGLGRVQSRTQLYPYGLARSDKSQTTNVYANSPRDRSVGLDHMGARFYAPKLGIWTSADPAILTKPEQYATSEFAAANPYAYANLRPVTAADRDGQFWHLAVGAAAGALLGGSVEAARQYISTGKIEDWGRVGSAASGGAVTGTITAANPAVALGSMMGVGAASGAAGGVTTRLVQSGGKDAGTLTDLMVDTTVGAATAGIVKGGSTLLRKVAPAKPVAPPSSQGAVKTAQASAARGAAAMSTKLAAQVLKQAPGNFPNMPAFGKAVGWGRNGGEAAFARAGSITKAEAQSLGITSSEAFAIRDAYRAVINSSKGAANPTALGREALMNRVGQLLQ